MTLSYNLAYQEIILVHPTDPSDFCWQTILYFLEHLRMSHIKPTFEVSLKESLPRMRKYQQLSCTYLCRALVALLDPKSTQILQRKQAQHFDVFPAFYIFLFISKHQCSIKVWITSYFFWHIAKKNTGLRLHPNCKSAKWRQQVVALILTLSAQWCIQVEKGLKGLFHSKKK